MCGGIPKKWLSKNTQIPRPTNLVRKYRHFFKIMFDSVGFTYGLRICMVLIQISKIYQDSTTEKSLKTLGDTNCFGPTRLPLPPKQNKTTCLMSGRVGKFGNFGVPKWWDMKIMCLRMIPQFCLYFLKCFGDKKAV